MRMFILLLAFLITGSFGDDEPTVKTKNGLVKGIHGISYDGNTFSSFEGIPFAKPPEGELRFKEAQPMTPWIGTWVANTKYKCAQYSVLTNSFEGQEDCLYLNVYVPRKQPNGAENLSVIAYIHGGAFMMGAGNSLSGPQYLMDREVVFVSINYRLGPFGFLSTQDDDLPGNLGLWDQTLALKWIQENIASFGGNPKSVTLTGMSAGAASVHYHYVSLASKGLFHRGFSQSGTILQPWALQKVPRDNAKKLGALTGCYDESSAKMLKCLRQRSAQVIAEAVPHFYEDNLPVAPFGPTVERIPTTAFVRNHPYYLVKRGIVNDVPWIISVVTDEGIIPSAYFVDNLDYLDKNWDRIAPNLLDFNFTTTRTQRSALPGKVKERYFLNKTISKDTIKNLVQVVSDRLFTIEAEKAAREHASAAKSSVYFLVVGYKGQHSLANFVSSEKIDGVSHGDDGFFYLYPGLPETKLKESSEKVKNLYLDMLVEYSRTGVPKFEDVEWRPVSNEKKLSHLFFGGPDDIKMKEVDELGATDFWKWASLKENENIVLFTERKDNDVPPVKKDEDVPPVQEDDDVPPVKKDEL